MGLCVSYDAAADGPATARVVLPSGELREYSPPATAALALEEVGEKGWFLCDADRMGFEGSLAAVAAGEELQPGQIYFVLPSEMLRRRLAPEEVASLAVKASAALVKAATVSSAGEAPWRRSCSRRPRRTTRPRMPSPWRRSLRSRRWRRSGGWLTEAAGRRRGSRPT